MNGNIAKIGLVSVLILISISVASAATITVNDDGGADYTKIQDAVDAASAGDFIEVWNGTYNENVDVGKRLTIYSRDGADVTIVEALSSGDHVFHITVDYVNISGFTVRGATEPLSSAGFYLDYYVDYCNMSDNNINSNCKGISIRPHSSSNTIINNNISNNNEIGIYLGISSSNNTITNNNISNHDGSGIWLSTSSNGNIITCNNLNNARVGFAASTNNTVTNNTFENNGIIITGSDIGVRLRHH
jgi:parallel beta-helix repeat protein